MGADGRSVPAVPLRKAENAFVFWLFFRWFQAGPDRLLCPEQHEASPVQSAAAALRHHDAAPLDPHSHASASAAPDETPAARAAAAAAPEAASAATASPAGLSETLGLITMQWLCLPWEMLALHRLTEWRPS